MTHNPILLSNQQTYRITPGSLNLFRDFIMQGCRKPYRVNKVSDSGNPVMGKEIFELRTSLLDWVLLRKLKRGSNILSAENLFLSRKNRSETGDSLLENKRETERRSQIEKVYLTSDFLSIFNGSTSYSLTPYKNRRLSVRITDNISNKKKEEKISIYSVSRSRFI